MAIVNTLSFSETSRGWTSFWDYAPLFAFSLKGVYYTAYNNSLWEHYDALSNKNRGSFYGTYYPSNVTLILNNEVSVSKNFKTVNYEGTNGWQLDSFVSDEYYPNLNENTPLSIQDTTNSIKSYAEGIHRVKGKKYYSGFKRKENKYYSNLKNNSVILREGQVLKGKEVSGIKGLFAVLSLSTDNTTDLGGKKQLFSVSSEYVFSAI